MAVCDRSAESKLNIIPLLFAHSRHKCIAFFRLFRARTSIWSFKGSGTENKTVVKNGCYVLDEKIGSPRDRSRGEIYGDSTWRERGEDEEKARGGKSGIQIGLVDTNLQDTYIQWVSRNEWVLFFSAHFAAIATRLDFSFSFFFPLPPRPLEFRAPRTTISPPARSPLRLRNLHEEEGRARGSALCIKGNL